MGDISDQVPAGFSPHLRKSPLTKPWEPLYAKTTDSSVTLGLRADEQHCNARGFVHGGLISALSDNAMGLSCAMGHEKISGLVTVTLNIQFLAAAQKGQWLEFITSAVKTGKTLDTAQGCVTANGVQCAFINATFRVLNG